MTNTVDPYYEWLGIPPKDQPPNHYRLLGLEPFEENRNVIDAAANRQMSFVKEYQAGEDSELSQKLLNELSAARLCLLTPDKKALYDQGLRAHVKTQEVGPPPPRPVAGNRWRTEERTVETAGATTHGPPAVPVGVPRGPPDTPRPISLLAPADAEARAPAENAFDELLPPFSTKFRRIAATAGAVLTLAVVGVLAYFVGVAFRPPPQAPGRAVAKPPQESNGGADRPGAEIDAPGSTAKPATFSPPSSEAPAEAPDSQPKELGPVVPLAPEAPTSVASHPTVKVVESVSPPPAQQSALTAAIEPPGQNAPASPKPLPTETWDQIETRLKAAAELASSPTVNKAVANEAFTAANRALLDSQREVSQRLAQLALTAARKAGLVELEKEAALVLVEWSQPITEEVQAKARQRLADRGAWE